MCLQHDFCSTLAFQSQPALKYNGLNKFQQVVVDNFLKEIIRYEKFSYNTSEYHSKKGKKGNARNARKEQQTMTCSSDVCCNEEKSGRFTYRSFSINWKKMKNGGGKKIIFILCDRSYWFPETWPYCTNC